MSNILHKFLTQEIVFSDIDSRYGSIHFLHTSLPITSNSVLLLFGCRKFGYVHNLFSM